MEIIYQVVFVNEHEVFFLCLMVSLFFHRLHTFMDGNQLFLVTSYQQLVNGVGKANG